MFFVSVQREGLLGEFSDCVCLCVDARVLRVFNNTHASA